MKKHSLFSEIISRARVLYLEALYQLHLRVRYGHDALYYRSKTYKKYSDNPITSVVHKITLMAFVVSFFIFTLMQYIVPDIFNLTGPEKTLASPIQEVRTTLEIEGTKISNVKTDVLPMGENDTTSSVIISWQTNKLATTLVEYEEGVIGGSYKKSSIIEDTSLIISHAVAVKKLTPALSYHYRLVSKDKSANITISQDYTFVTPFREQSNP